MNAEQYRRQLQMLLPTGAAWPRAEESTLTNLLNALSEGLAKIDIRAWNLHDEWHPDTTLEMLFDWERVAGLPDKCSQGAANTVRERQAVLTAKITGRGGQSRQYFIDLAKTLGYAITITEFAPFRVGQSAVGDPLCSPDWSFVWRVNAPATTVREFRAGQGAAGEPLRDWGNQILECSITADKPAHTHLIFAYGV